MPGGRPTKYEKEYAQQLLDYCACNEDGFFPTKAGFAIKIGVDRDTLKEWASKHSDFSAAYKKVEDYQYNSLIPGALQGKYNPTFSIFFAKNNLGMTDKQELAVSGFDEFLKSLGDGEQ